MTDVEVPFVAQNIVNQLGDLWKVPVPLRQATNDRADQFVAKLLADMLTAAEVKVLTETALRLGRKEAGEEIADALEAEARRHSIATAAVVLDAVAAPLAREIGARALSQGPQDASDATSVPSEGPGTSEMIGGSKEPLRRDATYPVDDDHPKGCLCPSCAKESS